MKMLTRRAVEDSEVEDVAVVFCGEEAVRALTSYMCTGPHTTRTHVTHRVRLTQPLAHLYAYHRPDDLRKRIEVSSVHVAPSSVCMVQCGKLYESIPSRILPVDYCKQRAPVT